MEKRRLLTFLGFMDGWIFPGESGVVKGKIRVGRGDDALI